MTDLNALPADSNGYLEHRELVIATDQDNFIPQFLIYPEGVNMPAIDDFP